MSSTTSAIGIFDSGIGGLTVAKSVMEQLPNENIIYFGDTARVPYGIKSEETIQKYASQITRFLRDREVKMIIIACNTVSAVAAEAVSKKADDIPVMNVISAGTEAAIASGLKNIGVIGTLATIGSGAYEQALKHHDKNLIVRSKACPLMVPLAEEGWTDNDVAMQTLDHYLAPFKSNGVEAIILGCTHYPLFKPALNRYFSRKLALIDSADSVAQMAKQYLQNHNLQNCSDKPGEIDCHVSDRPQRFKELAGRFLGRPLSEIRVHDAPEFP